MDLNDYQQKSRRTQNHALTRDEQLTNAAMGLSGEVNEYIHDSLHNKPDYALVNELGDVLYYASWLADLANLNLKDVHEHGLRLRTAVEMEKHHATTPLEELIRFTRAPGLISELIKKYRYHGTRTPEAVNKQLRDLLPAVIARLECLIPEGMTINEIAAHNHKKLLERYPSGFPQPA